MATFAELSADNPNIRAQYDEWAPLRAQTAKTPPTTRPSDSTSWHIGAPEPGRGRDR